MINTNEIDWNEVRNQVTTGMGSGSAKPGEYGSEKSVFLKMKAGFHHLRLVPAGNALKKTFFLRLLQHPIKVPKDDGSGWMDQFVLCWSYVLDDLMKLKDDPVAQKTKSFVSYLGQVKAITPEEFQKYQTYGCPMCKAFNRLNEMGADNETKLKFYPKEQFFFNVIWRRTSFSGQPAPGDDEVYIWRASKTIANNVISTVDTMMREGGTNYLDIMTGRDLLIQATGEKLARRYPSVQFVANGTPLNLGERIPHNLVDVMVTSNKEYQKVVNYMKAAYGQLLTQYGHMIAGDSAMTQQYQDSINTVAKITETANQVIAQGQASPVPNAMLSQVPPNTMPGYQPTQSQIATGNVPMNNSPEPKWLPGDQLVERNGNMVNLRTGEVMF